MGSSLAHFIAILMYGKILSAHGNYYKLYYINSEYK